jgi:Uma2 family endonuclease
MMESGPFSSNAGALAPDGTVMSTLDYLASPETNRVQELHYGVLRVAESPTSWHQDLVFEIAVALRDHVRRLDIGKVWIAPLDVVLDPGRALIVQPDLMFISRERSDIVTNRVYGPPDLVVEVLSPHPRIGTAAQRLEWFRKYGVRECWFVHQLVHSVEVVTFDESRTVNRMTILAPAPIRSAVLPVFDLSLEDIIGEYLFSGSR